MDAKLHFTVAGEGPAVVLIHGLFGMSNNLGALAKALQQSFRVYSIDLPSHGRSPWVSHLDLPTMANLVSQWMDSQGIARAAIVGHSLGGKVAMELALREAGRVSALVVADIAPVSYAPSHQQVFAAIEAVAAQQISNRSQAREVLEAHLQEAQVIQFLLLSLARGEDGFYHWRFNAPALQHSYPELLSAPAADGRSYLGPVLFVKGALSDYILKQHYEVIINFFPEAQFKLIANTGHWLHAEYPQLFNGIVQRFLATAS